MVIEYALELHYAPGDEGWGLMLFNGDVWTTTDPVELVATYNRMAEQSKEPDKWVRVVTREVSDWKPYPKPV